MAKLYVMVGIPGSGKSHESRRIAEEMQAKIYSSDIFRAQLKLDASVDKQNDDLFDMMYAKIREELDAGNDIVLDATNTYAKYRRKFFKAIEGSGAQVIAVVVMRQYENCLKANAARKHPIREEVIRTMYEGYDLPYYDEPWSEIRFVYPDNDEKALGYFMDFKEGYRNFPQDNPHHLEMLGDHLEMVYNEVKDEEEALSAAAVIHDCGKPFCKTFYNYKNELTEIAHYTYHDHVGSYMAMFFDFGEDKDRSFKHYVAYLIRMHMRPFDWEASERRWNRDQREMKAEWIEHLKKLHAADLKCSISDPEELKKLNL